MDHEGFESFLRAIATTNHGTTRRAAVTTLVALLTPVANHAEAKKKRRKKKKKCTGGKKRCGKKCIPRDNCCNDSDCSEITVCRNGECVCPDPGQAVCDATCIDVSADPANCGDCDFACASGECVNGACTCESAIQCAGLCACAPRLDGGNVCFAGGNNGIPCDSDEDCPFRSLCFDNGFCSVPCLG
jgi:hypothetical protein